MPVVMDGSCPPISVIRLGPSRLAVIGELDLASVPELERQLAGCDGDVALDCSGLTFVDAMGLRLFVRTQKDCENRGVKFTLVEPSRCLARLLAITGLDEVFNVSASGASGP